MGCGERKQDPTAAHTLSIFREVRFPAVFLALISQHVALKADRVHQGPYHWWLLHFLQPPPPLSAPQNHCCYHLGRDAC